MADTREIVEWLDPDWRSHFIDAEQAAQFYRQFSPAEWREAVKELS